MLLKGIGVRYAQETWRRPTNVASTSLLLIKSAVPPKHISHRWPKQSKLKIARGRNIWDLVWNNIKISVVVQFYPCFKFYFLLLQTHYHVIIIHCHTQKQKKIKFEPRIKLNHNIYIFLLHVGAVFLCLQETSKVFHLARLPLCCPQACVCGTYCAKILN